MAAIELRPPTLTARTSPVDDVTGLIRWVSDIPVEPGEPRVFNASVKMADTTTYNAMPCYDNNGGSGLTAAQARGAAMGEGLERYCCSVFDPADLVLGTAAELGEEHELCRPDQFALFHPDQPGRYPPPADDTAIAWTWGWSLPRHQPVLVPACLVYMPYFPQFRDQGEAVAGPAISTGLACAEDIDQAVLKGIYECVERDAFMVMWMNRLPVPSVDFESHPSLRELYNDRLRRDGLRYVVLRMTTDIPIPSFLCLLIDERRTPPMLCAGGASDLDPVAAVAKAMTEAVQTREWAKFLGGRDRAFNFAPDFSDIRDFEDHVALYAYGDMLHAVGFLTDDDRPKVSDCWDSASQGDASRDLAVALGQLTDHHLDVLALDLTTPDVADTGYRVTRVMVPELQPLDADYHHRFLGGRRLYEAPARMGYAPGPTSIETLNPYPHPYP